MKMHELMLCCVLVAAGQATADVLEVPSDANPTIQDAINAAANGDSIRLAAGVFHERIDLDGKAISIVGSNAGDTILDGNGNGPVVTMNNGEGPNTVLIDLVVQNGAAPDGGGLMLVNASPILKRCLIRNCHAEVLGGGIAVGGGSPVLLECQLIDNTARSGGGIAGLFAEVDLQGCTLNGNIAEIGGGGVHVERGGLRATETGFIKNRAHGDGLLADDHGGGGVRSSKGVLILEHCLFQLNESHVGGGLRTLDSNVWIEDTTFEQNEAVVNAGGASLDGNMAFFTRCHWNGNQCSLIGGGLDLMNVTAEVNACTWTGNHSGLHGGGVATYNASLVGDGLILTENQSQHGGGCLLMDGYTNLKNVEASRNSATMNGGAFATVFGLHYLFAAQIHENTAFSGGGLHHDSSEWDVRGSEIKYNQAENNGGGFTALATPNGKLANTTICGNAPNQTIGFFNDLGMNTIADVCDGDEPSSDIDNDGQVGIGDLLEILNSWGICPQCGADLNLDDRVDVVDLLQVIADWGSLG